MLCVRRVSGEVIAEVSVEDCHNVLKVKLHLRTLRSFPVSLQQLLCDGRCLKDDEQPDATAELQLVMLSVVGKEQRQQAENELVVYAAEVGDLPVARSLLQAGVDKDCAYAVYVDGQQMTALSVAARTGHTEVVRLLLHSGADKNLRDVGGKTALAYAARVGHTEIARLLVDAGADMDLQDMRSMTPLIHAASEGHAEIVRLLADAGADKNWQDQYGRTALAHAAHCGHTEIIRHLSADNDGTMAWMVVA